MKNKLKLMMIFCLVIIMSSFITVNAQSTTITASGESVDSGKEITITLTSTVSLQGYTISMTDAGDCTFKSATVPSNVNGSVNGSTVGGVSTAGTTTLATYKFTAPSVTADKKCTIKFSISGILSADDEELSNTSATAIITVEAPVSGTSGSSTGSGSTSNSNTGTNNTGTSDSTATVTKSTEARLKNLGIKPNDFKGFKKDKYEYSTEVPNSVGEVEIYAEKVDSKATIEGTGKVTLKEGSNAYEIKVTAEDGKTTKTYKLTINRRTEEEENETQSEARLSNLGIKPEEYDFTGFNKDKTEYSVEIPGNVEEIEVYATAVNSNAQITGTGIITLEEGENTLSIEVISENGTKKTYTIKVTRTEVTETTEEEEAPTEEIFGLSKLSIVGLTLNPKFDVETTEYTIDLTEDLSSLEIILNATDEDATIEIVGNENLQEGENTITILVKNEETEEVATYQITVNKILEKEEIVTSWLKPATWGKEEKIKIAIIIVLIILIISAIILKMKISKECQNDRKVEFPGADELDKAIAEHQELSEEENYQENVAENRARTEVEQNYIEEIAKNRLDQKDDLNTFSGNFDTIPKRRGKHF